jgi:hypothetical protein
VLAIQLQQHNHYLYSIASKQCLADKEEHNTGNHPYGGGLHPLTTKGRKCRVILYKRAHGSTRRLRSVQGLRDLHPHYITKTDDCDWLEISLLWTAHTPCGVNSLRKSNQIESNRPKDWTAHTPCGVNSFRKLNQIKSNRPKDCFFAALTFGRYLYRLYLTTR